MNFKQATDALLQSVTLEDLAATLGVSVQSVRQARVSRESTSHRAPPKGWEAAVQGLVASRIKALNALAKALK